MQTSDPDMLMEDREAALALMFRAARTLVETEGIEGLTLGKVALEAQLPRPVVYAQFLHKEDLLLRVATDSVVSLARRIGGIDVADRKPKLEESREGAVILTLPRPEIGTESPETMVELAREVSSALVAASAPGDIMVATGSDRRAARRTERARVVECSDIARTDNGMETSVDVAGAAKPAEGSLHSSATGLEVRLQEFERAVAAMEARQQQLAARLEESETLQKGVAREVRAAITETNVRLQTVEGVARAALVENSAVPPVETPAQPSPILEVPGSEAPEDTKAEPSEASATSASGFLASARASANAGTKVVVDSPQPPRSKHLRYGVAGLVVLALFVASAGLAFDQGRRDGRSAALSAVAPVAARAHVVHAADAPLDQLTARAEAGDPKAELAIAMKYLDAAAVPRNPAAGFRWMTRAALHGNPVAQYKLGALYLKGDGIVASAAQAMHWYEAAARQGNRKAMHDLAIAYAQGLGGTKDLSEAVRWLSRAASLGYVDSQFDLAVLYERGEGVPQSLLDAYKWYAIAGAQGDAESKARIEALRTQLSGDDVAAAQHAADIFRALPFSAAANLPPKI